MDSPDICIAGAGIIGLTLALELHDRGARVTVLDQGEPLSEASTAAAGMLAADDPDNPPELYPLSNLSREIYPQFLDRLFELSGTFVPFQTTTTLQKIHSTKTAQDLTLLDAETLSLLLPQLKAGDCRFALLSEHSLDPRELAKALYAAVASTRIDLRSHVPVRQIQSGSQGVEVHTSSEVLHASRIVDCTGAWGVQPSPERVRTLPRKGQMLAVRLPQSLPLHVVVRTGDIYIVPRTTGKMAGRAVIGATVEDAGFDKTVQADEILRLRQRATELLPDLAEAEEVETWAGLRPGTSDGLPLLGAVAENHFLAAGHYRNGILLAPATGLVMAQILSGEDPDVDLSAFSPLRHG
ncbi:MAG TPA: FAD-dependent oxidoreductase [Edaphobacter sp.]|jgi:glycine oxidase